jgi:hypothetical protein
MPLFHVARAAVVKWADDEVHCAENCPHMERGEPGSRPRCVLWDVALIMHDKGAILPPACRSSRSCGRTRS